MHSEFILFLLTRLKVQAETFLTNKDKDTDDKNEKIGDLKTYYQTLNKYKAVLKTVHRISLTEAGPKDVLSLCIYFEDDSSYQPIKEVRFPRINEQASYKFDLDIIPVVPLPTKKMTRCEFVDGDQTFRCQLSDLDIAVEDLFIPLPVEITSPTDKERDFQTLWDWFAEDAKQEGSTCLESVITIQKHMADFLSSIKPCLRTCQVSEGADFVKYGVFLPPNKHLLISVTSQKDYVIMKLITDFYQSLLFIRQLI